VISRETLQESASHFTNGQGLWFFTLFLKTNPIIIVIVIMMMMMMLMMINITSFLIVLICFLETADGFNITWHRGYIVVDPSQAELSLVSPGPWNKVGQGMAGHKIQIWCHKKGVIKQLALQDE
jgi:hypothetical protein